MNGSFNLSKAPCLMIKRLLWFVKRAIYDLSKEPFISHLLLWPFAVMICHKGLLCFVKRAIYDLSKEPFISHLLLWPFAVMICQKRPDKSCYTVQHTAAHCNTLQGAFDIMRAFYGTFDKS